MLARQTLLALAAAAACFSAAAQTAANDAAPSKSAQARYEQERAACLNGGSHQDRATCLKEAGAARDAARHGQLTTPADLETHATSRCNALPEGDRADCHSRVRGDANTTVNGTVKGGGVVKETTTRYVMTPEGEKRIQ